MLRPNEFECCCDDDHGNIDHEEAKLIASDREEFSGIVAGICFLLFIMIVAWGVITTLLK